MPAPVDTLKHKKSDTWEAAIAFHRRGKLAEAEAQYWKLLLERSDDDDLLINLGSALSGQEKFSQAILCFRRAIAINPENWRSHGNLGNAFRRVDKLDRAQASYQHAIAIDDSIAMLHYYLGDTLRRKEKLTRAASSLRKALELQPDYIDAFIALSAIEETTGNHDQARKTLLEGMSLRPYYTEICPGKALARTLLFFGLEDCRFRLNENFNIKISGGHFLTTELLRRQKFTKNHYHITDENLLSDISSLPPHDLIVNTIACPDRERNSLEILSRYLRENAHAPLINAPKQVLQTTRNENYTRLHNMPGMTFPLTLRAKRLRLFQTIEKSGLSFPIILRRVGTQSAVSTQKIETSDAIADYLDTTEGDEFYAIEFIDCRFKEKYFRKLRLFCIDGKLYPAVCHIDAVWNVHGGNRKTLMKKNPWMQDEEKHFLENYTAYIGIENRRRLESLHAIIELDFYGIDFTLMEDNSILIFELNAAMRHSFVHAETLPYLTPYLSKISDAFEAMALRKMTAR